MTEMKSVVSAIALEQFAFFCFACCIGGGRYTERVLIEVEQFLCSSD